MSKSFLFFALVFIFMGSTSFADCLPDKSGLRFSKHFMLTDGEKCEATLVTMFDYDLLKMMIGFEQELNRVDRRFNDFGTARTYWAPRIRENHQRALAALTEFVDEFSGDPRISQDLKTKQVKYWTQVFKRPLENPRLIFVGTTTFGLSVESILENRSLAQWKVRAYSIPLSLIENGQISSEQDILEKYPELVDPEFVSNPM